MKDFAQLVKKVGDSTKTSEKLQALAAYLGNASDSDKVWAVAIFTGRRPKRFVNTKQLTEWALELSVLPKWLFEECYHTVGDLAETIALLLPKNTKEEEPNLTLSATIASFIALQKADDNEKQRFVQQCWMSMDHDSRFVFNKLITGGFRIGVSQRMMVNALAKVTQQSASNLAYGISGKWDPASTNFAQLTAPSSSYHDPSKPYPFYLAYQLDDAVGNLGETALWQAEWKWDGIRGQIIKRQGQLFIWSRGEELMTERFPELHVLANWLKDGTVLDGEIIAVDQRDSAQPDLAPAPFALLQTRIGRKTVSKKQLQEAPIGFIAYDLLEFEGEDYRNKPLCKRREQLSSMLSTVHIENIGLSPVIDFESWEELAALRMESRSRNSEGIMLKRKNSIYQVGRKVGDWWKWKIDPLTIDAVMIYAQKGHGRRSNLYTDYTFAVSDGEKLVPFTKAYSGLTDQEFAQVDAFVKRNSLEKFGPVRTVKPELVFEIAFEGIAASKRHKSGLALRFPRISRWRKDKTPGEINTIEDLRKMLRHYGK